MGFFYVKLISLGLINRTSPMLSDVGERPILGDAPGLLNQDATWWGDGDLWRFAGVFLKFNLEFRLFHFVLNLHNFEGFWEFPIFDFSFRMQNFEFSENFWSFEYSLLFSTCTFISDNSALIICILKFGDFSLLLCWFYCFLSKWCLGSYDTLSWEVRVIPISEDVFLFGGAFCSTKFREFLNFS